jgi:hypothetical protein
MGHVGNMNPPESAGYGRWNVRGPRTPDLTRHAARRATESHGIDSRNQLRSRSAPGHDHCPPGTVVMLRPLRRRTDCSRLRDRLEDLITAR